MYKLLSLVLIYFFSTLSADDHVSLFFSEYAEGSSNNKYLEIYNGTGVDVDLSEYSISSCSNGCDVDGEFDYPNNIVFSPGTILPHGEVYVVCHPSASDGIAAECDQTFLYLSNGDDFFALTEASDLLATDVYFSGEFGGASDEEVVGGGVYTKPAGAESWAGFANEDVSIYPFSFPEGGTISFVAATAGVDANIYFRFEYLPFPDVEPSYNTSEITISGSDASTYTVDIPTQGTNIFSSFLLYVTTPDVAVTITDVAVSRPVPNVVVDKIGDFGVDPGSGWDVAGVSNGTKDYTLVRKSSIAEGNDDWVVSAGATAEDSEWVVNERPTADYTPSTLGYHLNDVCENPSMSVVIEMYDSWGDGWNGATYTIYGAGGAEEASGGLSTGSFAADTVCLYQFDNFNIVVGGGSYDSEISFSVLDAYGNVLYDGVADQEAHYFAVTGVNEVVGCTDPGAVNYDPNANSDNGTCYFEGDICEAPIMIDVATNEDGNAESYATASALSEQWFKYTAVQTGNLTVSTVGLTPNDTYVSLLTSCTIDSVEIDGSWQYFYADEVANNDDVVVDGGLVYQSEVTICVTSGQEIYIAWLPLYYPYEDTFTFGVYETPDITTPVNLVGEGYEDGIMVSWDPIPSGCVSADEARVNLDVHNDFRPIVSKNGVVSLKPGAVLKAPTQLEGGSRSADFTVNQPRRSLTRDCADGTTEVTFVAVCEGFNCYESEQSYTVVGSDGTVYIGEAENSGSTYTPIPVCLADGDYTVTVYDSWGDGWNGATLYAQVDGANVFSFTITSGSEGSETLVLNSSATYGCTDPEATNYDASATDDDGSCIYAGDVCEVALSVSDAATGVTNGIASWYELTVPLSPGKLTVSSAGFGGFNLYSTCDFGGAPDYDGQIYYEYFSTGEVQEIDFSSASVDDGEVSMDTYLGSTIYVYSGTGDISFTYEEYIYGCTDPNASNYDATANADDGSCECASLTVEMTMYDSYGDGWNGNTYAIVDEAGTIVGSGTMPSMPGGGIAYPVSETVCLPGDGNYSVFVGSEPAEVGTYPSEISWVLTDAESGAEILSGGAPFGSDNTFPVPLPDFTFAIYRDGALIQDDLETNSYFDPASIDDVVNLVGEQQYCYTVTQTDGIGASAVTSEQSDPACAELFVPSSCETAQMAELDSINTIEGVNGRDEWFYHVATQDGYLTITSDIPGNDIVNNDTRVFVFGGSCDSLIQIGFDDDSGEGYLSVVTVVVFEGDTVSILFDNYWTPGPSIWTLFETPAGVNPPFAFTAEGGHERIHLSWMYPQGPLNVALAGIHHDGNSVEQNSRNISFGRYDEEKIYENRDQLMENASSVSASRELDLTSSIGVAAAILNEDGTADIIINWDNQSSDVSYADAIRYTFPAGIVINGAVDASGTMSGSTSSAGDCSITIDSETNSVIFGAADFLDDSESGSGWGCLNLTVHQHSINVSAYSEEISIDYYAADDCYQSCGDFSGTMVAPVPEDNPCFDDELESVYDHILGAPETYTPLTSGQSFYPDLSICPGDLDLFYVEDFEYGSRIDFETIDLGGSQVMWTFFWDLNISEDPIFATNSYASGDTVSFYYQNMGSTPQGPQPGLSTNLAIGVFCNAPLDQTVYSLSANVRPAEQYHYSIFDAGTDAVIEDSIMGYHFVHQPLVNGQEYSYYMKTTDEIGFTSPPSYTVSATPVADVVNPPQDLVGLPVLQGVELYWNEPASGTPGETIESALPIDMLPFVSAGNTGDFQDDYEVACPYSSDSPDVVYAYTATMDTVISVSTCLSSYDTKVFVFESSEDMIVGCDDDFWGGSSPNCNAWTSYIDSVVVTTGNTYYIVVDGYGGGFGQYRLDVDYLNPAESPAQITSVQPGTDIELKDRLVEELLSNSDYNTIDQSRALLSYEIYRNDEMVGTTSADLRAYYDGPLETSEEGISYSYYVKAVFDGGTSDPSNTVSVVPQHPIDVPEPVNFMAEANGYVVHLDWEAPDLGDSDTIYVEDFNDGTLGTMVTEDLTGVGGAIFQVGTTTDATSDYWSPPDFGTFAFYNDDAVGETGGAAQIVLYSASIDLSGLSSEAIEDLALVGDLYYNQPSGACETGGAYSEDLVLVVRIDGGEWESRGFFEPTVEWGQVVRPLSLPSSASSVEVGVVYDDCGGNWAYGVAVDNFAVTSEPSLVLLGYNIYRDDAYLTSVGVNRNSLTDVVGVEGSYDYSISSVVELYGESDLVGPLTVEIVAPGPVMHAPRDLVVTSNGLAAQLDWNPPAGGDQWFGYNNDQIGNTIGSTGSFSVEFGIRIPAEDLVDVQGKVLKEMRFAGGSGIASTTYEVQVWQAQQNGFEAGLEPVLIYASEPGPGSIIEEAAWNYYSFDEPVMVPPIGTELWFGLKCNFAGDPENGSYPMVVDNSPETVNGFSNLVRGFGSDWTTLVDFGFPGNLLIEGYISDFNENLAINGSFESWSPAPDGGWQTFPDGYERLGSDGNPYGNIFVDADSAGIYGSPDGSVLEVYDGDYALKIWGMYAGEEDMWGAVYQTHSVDALGGVGSMFTASVAVMSHEHDWIGQGTNYTTIWARYYTVDEAGVETDIDGIESEPFDATFSPSDWHRIGFDGMVPDGATHVDVGVAFYQANNDQNGSAYFDDLVIEHYGHSVDMDPVAIETSPVRTEGMFDQSLNQSIPVALFEEYIPFQNTRNHDMVMAGYKVYRNSEAVDIIEDEDITEYYDMVGEQGMFEYAVSAMYYDVDEGDMEEAMSDMVMTELSNVAPAATNLIAPEDDLLITLTPENIADESSLGIFWSNSVDGDGESVEYRLELCVDELNTCIDSVLSETNVFIPYSDLYGIITDSSGLTMLNIEWNVYSSDDWVEVPSSNGPWSVVIDAGWMLSVDEDILPEVFALHNNYPNPFNPITNIGYDVPEVSDIKIEVFNLAGQKVRTLVSKQHQPGRYKVQWNATNEFGSPVASGMYVYKIHAKNFVAVKKLLLMK